MPRIFICCLKLILILVFVERCIVVTANETHSTIPKVTSWRKLITQRQLVTEVIKPYAGLNITSGQPICMQMQCKIICARTHIDQLNKLIENALSANSTKCSIIDELRLYESEFPHQKISYGFLGNYSNYVRSLYIGSANVTDIDEGAFRYGIFKEIYLENLKLNVLRKDIFCNISKTFATFTVIQRDMAMRSVEDDFLGYIKYQLRSLTLQVGLSEISNITTSSSLLNNLKNVDLSYNNFTNTFAYDTFTKLSIVQYLDLSHSNIECLPIYIFSQLADSLVFLNISHNKLITINHLIFGRHALDESLIIDAQNNRWNCSCQLRKEMKQILKQSKSDNIICQTPAEYKGLSIWDERICADDMSVTVARTATTEFTTLISNVISDIPTPTSAHQEAFPTMVTIITTSSEIHGADNIFLQCITPDSDPKVEWKKILWSDIHIRLRELSDLRVEVTLELEEIEKSYGIIWFTKVVDDYDSMTINYDRYGLGCMGPISYITIISNLLPDTAYTFCLIGLHQLTIPPFHCESVHLGTNLEIIYTDSLARNMRSTSISLVILGVVLCCFLGISGIYKLLKYKPTLLKGSKRVKAISNNKLDIVILPKESSLQDLKIKEETLVKHSTQSIYDTTFNSPTVRRSSVVSVESSQSYINANLYEIIPAYLRLQGTSSDHVGKSEEFESIESYMPPLASKYECSDVCSVSYAEVSPRSKRASNDPLPALPTNQTEVPPSHIHTVGADVSLPLHGCMWSIKVSDAIL